MRVLSWGIRLLDKVATFSRWTNIISMVTIFLMVFLTFVDVICRYIFNQAITGAMEISEVMLAVAVFCAIANTHAQKSHINVDVFTSKLSPDSRLIVNFINTLMGIGLFIIIIWRTWIQALNFMSEHAFHGNAAFIPSGPFAIVIVVGCIAMGLLLVRDLLLHIENAIKQGFTWRHWTILLVVSILIFGLAGVWAQRGMIDVSRPMVGILGVLTSLFLILMGIPIAFALFIPGILFIGHIRGMRTAYIMLGSGMYHNSTEFVWATVAFFVLMGFFCLYGRFGEDLYILFNRWIGRLRGGLAMATAGSCTGFAAIVGDSVSSIATMTSVAMPEMKKYHYNDRLSTGSITAGAIIGPIIPPSVPFIIYGVLTQVSIGKLFIAGIIPGLLLGITFVITISLWCHFNPQMGPPAESSSWRQKFVSLKACGPILILFGLVIGGIYGGAFSPSEGGAMGAGGALIIALLMRRMTWKGLYQALRETAKVLSMILLIINGAGIFVRFVAWCNLSSMVSDFFTGLGLSMPGTVAVILLAFLLLGFIVDILTLTMIGVPILHPVAVAQGADPIWFALLVMLVMTLGALTPPIGLNLFTMKGMAPEIPMEAIYKGALPFVIASIVVIVIVFLVPGFATYLPNHF